MTPERRLALARLCEAATPGPWTDDIGRVDPHPLVVRASKPVNACTDVVAVVTRHPVDAAFIAASRTALPEALAEVDRLTAQAATDAEALAALRLRVDGIECDLRRTVVTDTLENMVAQVVSDRAALKSALAAKDKGIARLADDLRIARHELQLIFTDTERGRTDCSTPIFQRVRNICEYLSTAETALTAERQKVREQADEIATLRKKLEAR